MTSHLRKSGWDAYLRTRHAAKEKLRTDSQRRAEVAYARMLIQRIEERRRKMLRGEK